MIVTDAPGLMKVVDKYGIVVEKENVSQLAKAIILLMESPEL